MRPNPIVFATVWTLTMVSAAAASAQIIWDQEDMDYLGVTLEPAAVSPGQRYWKLVEGYADDPIEGSGRINIFFKTKDLGGVFLANIWVRTEWSGGNSDVQTKVPPEWGDFPMSGGNWCPATPPGPYSTKVLGRNQAAPDPSDRVVGMGLPCNEHWSFRLIFEETIAAGPVATNTPTQPPAPTNTPTGAPSALLEDYEDGFTGGVNNGWTAWQDGWGGPDQYAAQTGRTGTGNSQGIRVFYGSGGAFRQNVPTTPGEEYVLRTWIKTLNGDQTGSAPPDNSVVWAEFGYDLQNRSFADLGDNPQITSWDVEPKDNANLGSTQWQQFTTPAFTATGAFISIWVKTGCVSPSGLYLFIDDWELISTSQPTETETPGIPPTATPLPTVGPTGQPRWKLTYARQYGFYINAGNAGQAELFANWENGDYADVGMTNDANPDTALFGTTGDASDPFYTPGNLRVTFNDPNDPYDFHVYDPAIPSDRSPDCYWIDSLPHAHYYRFEFWWRKVADDARYQFYPYQPVYHYDLVNGFNDPPNEPPGFSSDASSLSDWAEYQAQTFVVPMNINRIIGAKCFGDKGAEQKFRMVFSIRAGSPTGTQVGPSVTSREKDSNEFPNVNVSWGMDDVPVTPGGTYALRVEVLGGGGMNVHATTNNTYTQGMLYNGATAVPGRDMVAVVVGAWKYAQPSPTSTPQPTPPTPTEPPITPTLTITPTPHHGVLQNPSLDDFANPNGAADHWESWTGLGSPSFLAEGGFWRHTTGEDARSQRWWSDAAAHDAGIRQQVAAVPGATYRFSAWMHHYQASTGNGPVNYYVGIDPDGGTELGEVVWSGPVPRSDAWEEISIEVTATGTNITVYGRCLADSPSVGGERSTFMDDAALVIVSEPPTATPTLSPTPTETPTPTQPAVAGYPDLFGFSQGWHRDSSETPFYQPEYDRNGDDRIDELDLLLFIQEWLGLRPGPTPPPTNTPRPPTATKTPAPPTLTPTPEGVVYENHFEVFQDFNPTGSFNPGDGSGGLYWQPPPSVVHTVDLAPIPSMVHWGGVWQPFDYLQSTNSRSGYAQEIRIRHHPEGNLDAYLLVFNFSGGTQLAPGRYEASIWVKSNYADAGDFTDTTIGHNTTDDHITASYRGSAQRLTDWTRVAIEFDVFAGDPAHYIFVAFGGNVAANPAGYVAGYYDDMMIRKIW